MRNWHKSQTLEHEPIRVQWTLEKLQELLKDYEPKDEEEKEAFYEVILDVWNNGPSRDFIPGFENV